MADLICAICCENFSGVNSELYPYVLPCSHNFHIKCLKESMVACGNFCPIERRGYENLVDEAKQDHRLAMRIEKEKKEGIKKEEKEFVILVKDLTNKSYQINVSYDFTEGKIFELVAALTGIPNGEFRLVAGTKNMVKDGQRILTDLGIGPLSDIFLLMRLKGGLKKSVERN